MTTTPTPAPEAEAVIERASHSIARIATVQNSPVQVWQAHVLAVNDLAAAFRSQAARIKELEAERDEKLAWASAWHRECETVATILDLPEPEVGMHAAAVRDKFDRLASRVERLRGALKKIADEDVIYPPHDPGSYFPPEGRVGPFAEIARAAYEETQDGE